MIDEERFNKIMEPLERKSGGERIYGPWRVTALEVFAEDEKLLKWYADKALARGRDPVALLNWLLSRRGLEDGDAPLRTKTGRIIRYENPAV